MKNILEKFENYLLNSVCIAEKSLKFYRSDFNHFNAWLILKIKTLGVMADDFMETIPFISKPLASEYKKYLLSNNIPTKTINRRLSTLRHLSRFLVSSQIIDSDFMEGQVNVPEAHSYSLEALQNFAKFLEKEKVSKNTSKNYLSDLRQFFTWLESDQSLNTNI